MTTLGFSKKNYILIGVLLLLVFIGSYGIYFYNEYIYTGNYKDSFIPGTLSETSAFTPIKNNDANFKELKLIAENNILKLYLDVETTFITLVDKATGKTLGSNPIEFDSDPIANRSNKYLMASQIEIEYYNINRNKKKMNNYGDAILNKQFTIESIKNGVRITYTLGNMEKGIESIPRFITSDRFQKLIIDKLDAKTAKNVQKQFIETDTKPGFLEMRSQVEKSKIVLKQVLDGFAAAGYTDEDLDFDNKQSGFKSEVDRVSFVIPLEYELTNETLIARINTQLIKDDKKGVLSAIKLLDFFGAGSSTDTGYLFVPNGSGSIINFNNGKTNHESYYQQVYGIDKLVENRMKTQSATSVRLPVYGSVINDIAFMAVIENGAALASITGDISGRRNNYNHVGNIFTLRDYESMRMFGTEGLDADLPLVEDRMYQGDISISYKFLTEKNANYSGMANYYREKLTKEGILKENRDSLKTPFYLDILGAYEKRSFIMGIPYYSTYVMTNFEDSKTMVNQLSQKGVSNIQARYLGWFNDGYYHDVARNIDVISKIGGKKGLINFNNFMNEKGGKLYPDAAFMQVSLTSDHYNPTFESARFIAGITAMDGPNNLATMRKSSMYKDEVTNLISPQAVIKHVDGFISDYQKLGITGLSLRDLGDVVFSDKRRQRPIDRSWATDIVVDQFKKLMDFSDDMLVVGGNSYSLPYANNIIDLPLDHNPFYIVDEAVPFYQMVIHGSINYSAEAFNISNSFEFDTEILKMIEYGSAPHFVFSKEPSSILKKTSLESWYSTQYMDWIEDAETMYKKVSAPLDLVTSSSIISHNKIREDIYKVSYDNGVVIYVNYSDQDFAIDGLIVPAKDFNVKRGVN